MRHTISLFSLLTLFWLANSGHYTNTLLILGLLSIITVILIAHRMDLVDQESQPLHLTLRMPGFFIWLFKEIVVANIDVLRCIWSFKTTISPNIIRLKVSAKSDMTKVIYANSITLTPGTVTIDIIDDEFTIHALTISAARALQSGIMEKRILELEK